MAEDLRDARAAFIQWDSNKDGVLTESEISENMAEICNFFDMVEVDVRRILRATDTDKNGEIDFTEFLTAAFDKRKLLSEENLRRAFDFFDRDGSGTISKSEIMASLCASDINIPQSVNSEDFWGDLMASVDKNNDGEITYE